MAAIVEKDWKTVDELIRWWHNRPKQIVGSEIDFAMKWAWKAAVAAEALKPSHNGAMVPCPKCKWSKGSQDYCSKCRWSLRDYFEARHQCGNFKM